MKDKFNPNSPKFNWTALAQRNEDVVKRQVKQGREHYDGRGERMKERHAKSERHHAAMYVAKRKIRGDSRFQNISFKEMMKGELGERY